MPDALHRLAYDATIDDVVDVSLRLANRTQAFRRQIRLTIIIAGAASGLVAILVWMLVPGPAGPFNATVALPLAAAFGVLVGLLFRPLFVREIRRQHRKVVAEQFGGAASIPSELEVRPDGVWVRQAGIEMIFPWSQCTGIQDRAGDIEVNFRLGICVVRDRHFPTAADRQAFLETARRLAKADASGTGGPAVR